MKTSKQLKEERAAVESRMTELHELAKKEARSFNAEESKKWDDDQNALKALDAEILRAEQAEELERRNAGKGPKSPLIIDGEKKKEQPSLLLMLRASAFKEKLDGPEADLVAEHVAELRASGLAPRDGYIGVPSKMVRMEKRDMTVTGGTSGSEGGVMVPTEVGETIPFLTPQLVTAQLGATVLSDLVGNLDLPRGTNNVTATWEGETTDADESNPTMDKVSLAPIRLTTFIDVSERLLHQTGQSVEAYVRNLLSNAVAQKIDADAINGSGSGNVPTGILNASSVGSVEMGTNGGVPTWAKIVELEGKVDTASAMMGNLHYLSTPGMRSLLKTRSKDSGSGRFINEGNEVNGYPILGTSLVPSNLTKGTGSGLHAILFGNWADLLIGQWGGMELFVDPYTQKGKGLVRIYVSSYNDIKLRNPLSFAAIKDGALA
jgi:HK97 family phage major capsid protein